MAMAMLITSRMNKAEIYILFYSLSVHYTIYNFGDYYWLRDYCFGNYYCLNIIIV